MGKGQESHAAEYAVTGFKNSNNQIREAAQSCITELYRRMGQKINGYLEGLRPAQKDVLKQGFEEIDGGGYVDEGPAPPKQVISTNINPHGKPSGGKKPQAQKPPAPVEH